MTSLIKRVIRQTAGDKRTVALIIVAPILILTLLSLLLGETGYKPTIAVKENEIPQVIISSLMEQDVTVVFISDSDAEQYLRDNKNIDAVFVISQSGSDITMYESSGKSGAALKAIQKAAAAMNPASQMRTHFVIGDPDETFFESMGNKTVTINLDKAIQIFIAV